ncbi:MAG: MFS transporter [Oscillospiraceae bacterium]|nr:MFS transporter [Oscillospiraceae bacterium]
MDLSKNESSIWTRNFILLFVSHMLSSAGVYMVNTLLPLYSRSMGATDTLIGFVSSAFYLVALAARPVSGPAIDAFNKKILFIFLTFGNALCMFGYGSATSIGWVIFFRMLHGITYGSQAALCLAMASGSIPKEKLSSGVATYTLSNVLPQALAPGIGLSLSEQFGYRFVYFVSGFLIVLAASMGFLMDYSEHERKPFRINLHSIFAVEATVPVCLLFLLAISSSAVSSFLVLHATDRGIEGVSFYYTISAICLVLFRPLTGTLSDKYGMPKVIIPCFMIYIVYFLLISNVSSKWELWFCAVLSAAGFSSAHTLLQALVMKLTPASRRGAASSSCYIGYDGGTTLGGMINGRIAEAVGYSKLFLYSTLPMAASILIMIIWVTKNKGIHYPEE